jgi:hypothetical protein
MGGYDIPFYVRGYVREWQRYDRMLRCRWSQDEPGKLVLERKTRYLYPPAGEAVRLGSDRAIQLSDEYRKVFVFEPRDIKLVLPSLQKFDIQRLGGAKALAERILDAEDREMELIDKARVAEFEAIAGELYDRLAWEERRRVAAVEVTS